MLTGALHIKHLLIKEKGLVDYKLVIRINESVCEVNKNITP